MPSVLPNRVHATRLERRVHHEIAIMNKTGVASEWLAQAALKRDWIMRLAFPLIAPRRDIRFIGLKEWEDMQKEPK